MSGERVTDLQFWSEHSSGNFSEAELLRQVVQFMDNRAELFNEDRSCRQLINEYLKIYHYPEL